MGVVMLKALKGSRLCMILWKCLSDTINMRRRAITAFKNSSSFMPKICLMLFFLILQRKFIGGTNEVWFRELGGLGKWSLVF